MESKLEEIINGDAFKITINDGFCTWEYELNPKSNSVCIDDIIQVLFKHFESPKCDGKLIDHINLSSEND